MPNVTRCGWARAEPNLSYHDTEWGVPLHDDRGLFEFLVLEGAQAGLSWETILKKRDNYREAFDGFDAERVARHQVAERSCLARATVQGSAVRPVVDVEPARLVMTRMWTLRTNTQAGNTSSSHGIIPAVNRSVAAVT